MKYDDYLKSPHWRAVRAEKLEAAGFRCERCGEFGKRGWGDSWPNLHVHHLSYERRGAERMDDLEVLCAFCHEVEHGKVTGDCERRREELRRTAGRYVTALHTTADDEIAEEVAAWDRIIESEEAAA